MIEYLLIFLIVYGLVWVARRSVNKRTWNTVATKLPNGKPENLLALNIPTNDSTIVKNKLISCVANSDYILVDATGNPLILEDKKGSANPLNTMYFYPVYISMDQSSQTHVEVGIADKSSFLGSKQDRMKKLQKLFDFLSRSLK
jgi:hypothetical protein